MSALSIGILILEIFVSFPLLASLTDIEGFSYEYKFYHFLYLPEVTRNSISKPPKHINKLVEKIEQFLTQQEIENTEVLPHNISDFLLDQEYIAESISSLEVTEKASRGNLIITPIDETQNHDILRVETKEEALVSAHFCSF